MTNEQRRRIKIIVDSLIEILEIDCPVDLEKLVNKLGGTINTGDIDNYAEGMVTKGDNTDKFVIYLSPNQSEVRRRFTIAHELGHLFLHMGFPKPDWNPSNKAFYRYGYSELEYQANEFAACLLMPETEFIRVVNENINNDGSVKVLDIAHFFEVSESAVVNRGRWLGVFQW